MFTTHVEFLDNHNMPVSEYCGSDEISELL